MSLTLKSVDYVAAMSLADGREIWRIAKNVTTPMDARGGLLYFSAGETDSSRSRSRRAVVGRFRP